MTSVKAYFRRAVSHEKCKQYVLSRNDYARLLKYEPGNVAAKRGLVRLDLLVMEQGRKMKEAREKEEAKKHEEWSQFIERPEYKLIDFVDKPFDQRAREPLRQIRVFETLDPDFDALISNNKQKPVPPAEPSKVTIATKVRNLICRFDFHFWV